MLDELAPGCPAGAAPAGAVAGETVEIPSATTARTSEVAGLTGLEADEVVRRHTPPSTPWPSRLQPRFPYLVGLTRPSRSPAATPPDLDPGRLGRPGRNQTGIYPTASPGGWQLIGRTEVSLFDPGRDPPALLAPGTRLRFTVAG